MPEAPAYPPTLWGLITRRAETSAGATMYVDDRGRSITFAGYQQRCEAWARSLHARHGVGPTSVVSWQLPTAIESMVLIGALARLGATQNPIIPMLRRAEVDTIAAQVRPQLLITARCWRGFDFGAMASDLSEIHGFDVLTLDLDDAEQAALEVDGADVRLPDPPATDAVRWIYHSSGTTAAPKAILHRDSSVMYGATGLVAVLGMDADDVYPIAFPNAHIGGVNNLTAQLMSGATLALSASFDKAASPLFMASVGATLLGSAIPFFVAYLDAQAGSDGALFPHLRACVNGGAPKTPELHRKVREHLGGVGVIGSYGLTEFPIATMGSLDDPDDLIATTEGRPVPGVEAATVDGEGNRLPTGVEGELVLRGPQLFAGYLDPELPSGVDAAGWFHTGDLAVIGPDGHIAITGRIKDIVIRNAENISALEVELALSTHPAIADVAVIAVPDDRTGERACAVVVTIPAVTPPTLDDIRDHCLALGLAIQKAPEQLETVDALPRNALGKVQKRELTARYGAAARR